jgi:hypothetical protein
MAAAQETSSAQPVADAFQALKEWRFPNRSEYVQSLLNLDPLHAVLLLAAGIVYMVYGWKVFKVLVVVNAAILGCAVGAMLGDMAKTPNLPVITAAAGGLLLAVLAWPLMKVAVAVMGALFGYLIGDTLWFYIAQAINRPGLEQYAWAGGLIGLVTLGMLAFVILQITVMLFTSYQGALMSVSGVLALLLRHQSFKIDLTNRLINDLHLLPLIIAVPSVIGFTLQYFYFSKKGKKKTSGESSS